MVKQSHHPPSHQPQHAHHQPRSTSHAERAGLTSEHVSLNNTMTSTITSAIGGESPKSMVSSVTDFRETTSAIVPVESSNKLGKQHTEEHKAIHDDIKMLRIVNSQARKHLMDAHEAASKHDSLHPTDSKPQSKREKAAERLRTTMQNVYHGVEAAMVANFAVGFIQEEVEAHHEVKEKVAKQNAEDSWNSMFTAVDTILEEEEEPSEEGEDDEQRAARLKRNQAKRDQKRKRERQERSKKAMTRGVKAACMVSHTQDKAAVRKALSSNKLVKVESSSQLQSQSSSFEPTTIFEPSSFYKSVHSVIGLNHRLRHYRERMGLKHEAESAEGAEGAEGAAAAANSNIDSVPSTASEEIQTKHGNIKHGNSDQTAGADESPAHRTSIHFSAALRVLETCKAAGRRRSSNRVKGDDAKAEQEYLKDQSPTFRLPPANPRMSASNVIAEEKVDEMGSLQSGGSLSSAVSAPNVYLMRERAARLAAREADEFAHARQMQYPGDYRHPGDYQNPYGLIQSRRRLGIGEFVSPSCLATEIWEQDTDDHLFDPDDGLNPSAHPAHEFPSELVCKAMSNLSVDDITRMFSDIRAPPNLSRPENGLELLERVFGGVRSDKQFPIQWLMCEWVLKDLQSKMLHSIRHQRGLLSEDSSLMMGHASGESFKKQLFEVQETLTHHYTLAPAIVSWGQRPQGSTSHPKDGIDDARGGTADIDMTFPRSRSSRMNSKPIRQAKLPYFPYNKDRRKVLNLNETPPTNWRSAQAVDMSTQMKGSRSAR
eukprot:gnl/MRDRNA2_/MRDRNA2_90629_c0_seq1.p1 gnl/MRDRNA2_/MRDRNA2_90629_c0~~gnl/MRDRNA2_/MRDRNA2_90629_c0_seq1.p1  ORF type:complete len:769 (+),score=159.13 gnl/MRDRNA2_/MRDRNA2_90629_c0_seq1:63-2369(+)